MKIGDLVRLYPLYTESLLFELGLVVGIDDEVVYPPVFKIFVFSKNEFGFIWATENEVDIIGE